MARDRDRDAFEVTEVVIELRERDRAGPIRRLSRDRAREAQILVREKRMRVEARSEQQSSGEAETGAKEGGGHGRESW